METKYKHIHFKEIPLGPHFSRVEWACLNNKLGSPLGVVQYYSPWKQYVIDFEEGCVFNKQCLDDISNFLTQLNEAEVKVKEFREVNNGKIC